MGNALGLNVGDVVVGLEDGARLVGPTVGVAVGPGVGEMVGLGVGIAVVGDGDGLSVGLEEGDSVALQALVLVLRSPGPQAHI